MVILLKAIDSFTESNLRLPQKRTCEFDEGGKEAVGLLFSLFIILVVPYLETRRVRADFYISSAWLWRCVLGL